MENKICYQCGFTYDKCKCLKGPLDIEVSVTHKPERPDHCYNCNSAVSEDEKYCRWCGTKVGEGIKKNQPEDEDSETTGITDENDNIQLVYGPPPVLHLYKCNKCGNEWTLNRNRTMYCSYCGEEVEPSESGYDFSDCF